MAARCDFLMRGETARVCDARALGWAREAIVGERRASLIDSRATIMAGKTWEAVYCVAVVVVMVGVAAVVLVVAVMIGGSGGFSKLSFAVGWWLWQWLWQP